MGGCLSLPSSPTSFDVIRVVHFNGLVEDFDRPVTAGELTGKPPKYFLCTSAELVSFSSSQAFLLRDNQLQRGQIYFLIPFSALQWEASAVDFATLATRLTKVAKRSGSNAKHPQSSPDLNPLPIMGRSQSTTERVNLISEQVRSVEQEQEPVGTMDRDKISYKAQSWKPILSTINERSFGRRSESDLQSPLIRTSR